MKRSITWAVCLVVGMALLATHTISGQASDPRMGRWQLNLAKSKFSGTAPKAQTRVYEDRGSGIVFGSITTTTATGNVNVLFVLYKLDGKDYPQVPRGAETTNVVSQKLVDTYTVEGVVKTNGKVTSGFTQTVSADGKTLTYVLLKDFGAGAECRQASSRAPVSA
jgi:hypothetical protein